MAYVTKKQQKVLQQLQQDGQIPKKVTDVVAAAMQLDNSVRPSSLIDPNSAGEILTRTIDALVEG